MTAWRKPLTALPGLAFIAAILALVQYLVASGHVRRSFLPLPTDIAATLWDIFSQGEFVAPLGSTLLLFAVGYTLAVIIGVGLGLLMGTSQRCYDLFEPLIEGLRPVPKAALVPALMLFLGLGMEMKVTAVVLASVFPILLNTIQGVHGIDPVLISTGKTFGTSRTAIVFKIILPAAMPYILAGIRVALAFALLTTILAEMLTGTGGLGALILDHQRSFRVRQMYSWLVILALLGMGLNLATDYVERRTLPWLEKYRSS
jgi:ABC-type nitrate/sulfonate/bicarbonate transport system permease component